MTSENRIKVLREVLEYDKLNKANHLGVDLSEWESDFIISMREKLARYGESGILISPKQFASLERILKKFEEV